MNSALLLSLPKLDGSSREAQAKELDASSPSRSKFHLPEFPPVYVGTPWLVSALLEMLQNQRKWDQMCPKLIHRRSVLQQWVRNPKVIPATFPPAAVGPQGTHPLLLSLEH